MVKEGQSLDSAETLILQSSVGYAIPGVSPGSLHGVMVVAAKYWLLHALGYLIRLGLIDGKELVENVPKVCDNLKSALRKRKDLPSKQVLAFTIDYDKLAEGLREEFIHELLRVAEIEGSEHMESPTTDFIKSYTGKTYKGISW